MSDMTKDRRQYLEELAIDYSVPREIVFAVADMLGPNEDYDGLISALEDYEYFFGE